MSFIPRIFLPQISQDQKEIHLDESTSRYLVKVLRFTEGSPFYGFDAEGNSFEMKLQETTLPQAKAVVLSRQGSTPPKKGPRLTLGQSLTKGSKLDLILRQGTEAGAHHFIPILTQRSVSRPEAGQFTHKAERWRKILVEACRQCGRGDLPGLDPVTHWVDLLKIFQGYDLVLIPYEKEAPTLKTVLESKPHAEKILILVGPEGGWALDEIHDAQEKGALPIHLPTPILRTETAGIAVLSMIQFFYNSPPEGGK